MKDKTCGFKSSNSASWKLGCSPTCNETSIFKSGPPTDHTTGTANGHFWIISMDDGRELTTYTYELTKTVTFGQPQQKYYCMSFWYYADGSDVDKFTHGFKKTTTNPGPRWARSGSQGSLWRYFEYTIQLTSDEKLAFFTSDRNRRNSGFVAIDDVFLFEGQCPSREYECTFDEPNGNSGSPCDITVNNQDNNKWQFNSGSSLVGIRKVSDHTFETSFGKFAYIDSDFRNSFAINFEQSFSGGATTSSYCLNYWYRLSTGTIDTAVSNGGKKTTILSSPENSGLLNSNQWSLAEAEFSSSGQFSLEFAYNFKAPGGIVTKKETIEIDDVQVFQQSCKFKDQCNFEEGLCDWHNAQVLRNFDWQIGTGLSGPVATDNTFQNSEGHYAYASMLYPRQKGDRARLVSVLRDAKTTGCIQFWYYLTNDGAAATTSNWLRLIAKTYDGELTLWAANEATNGAWSQASATIDMFFYQLPYELIFEAQFNNDLYGDAMAIDDVKFVPGSSCTLNPPTANPLFMSQIQTQCPFSMDFCYWTPFPFDPQNDGPNTPDWQWIEKDNVDKLPAVHFQVTSNDYYNETAVLESKSFVSDDQGNCLSFDYSLNGERVGVFEVLLMWESSPMVLFQRTENQGYRFNSVSLNVHSNYDTRILFTLAPPVLPDGETRYWSSFLSIRNVELSNGECPKIDNGGIYCDFDITCNLLPSNTRTFYKTSQVTSQAAGINMAPADHTTGTGLGYYAIVNPNEQSGQASFNAEIKATSDQCLFFWYQIGTSGHSGALFVILTYESQPQSPTTTWTNSKMSSNGKWRSAVAPIPKGHTADDMVTVAITAKMTPGVLIAIDDVVTAVGTCPHPIDCSFEDGSCGYLNEDGPLAWFWTAPASLQFFAAPSVDHTTGTSAGHLFLVDITHFGANQQVSTVSSDMANLDTTPGCIELWYQIEAEITSLELNVMSEDGQSLQSKSLNQLITNGWESARIDVPTSPSAKQFYLQMVVKVAAPGPTNGYVAVDDIKYLANTQCSTTSTTTMPTTSKFLYLFFRLILQFYYSFTFQPLVHFLS